MGEGQNVLVSFGTGQVSRILFPKDMEWLHNYSEVAFIAYGSCSEAYLPEGRCLGCGFPLAWKYRLCLSWPVLMTNILLYIQVTLCSIPLFCKSQKLWPGCRRTLCFHPFQILAHNRLEIKSWNYLFASSIKNKQVRYCWSVSHFLC